MQEVSIFSSLEQQAGSSGDIGLGFFPSTTFRLYKVFFWDEDSEAVSSTKTVASKIRYNGSLLVSLFKVI